MLSALIRKELFQCAGFCVLSLLACAALPSWLYDPNRPEYPPFLAGMGFRLVSGYVGTTADEFVCNFSLVGGILAFVLGLTQSAWEETAGTWQFLLFRPFSRQRLLAIKLLTGGSLLMVSTVIPGIVYGIWASSPGTHLSPFEWWMTEKFWQQWMSLPVMYLGSFQSGIREARWYGTRLLPCIASGGFCVMLAVLPFWWRTGFPLLMICLLLQLVTLFHTFKSRDFA